ncbi:uncharacterized protein PAE49_019536 isoform 3-T4 [Odontesthes bonariensis]
MMVKLSSTCGTSHTTLRFFTCSPRWMFRTTVFKFSSVTLTIQLSSPQSVGRLLQLRRQLVLLQFDTAVRTLIRRIKAAQAEGRRTDSSAPLHDPIRVQSVLKGFLLLMKQLEFFKESWAQRRFISAICETLQC